MKRFLCLVITFFTLGTLNSIAQVYGCYYFIPSGTELTGSTEVKIVYFSGNTMAYTNKSASTVSSKLSSNSSYWKNNLRNELSRRQSDDSSIKYNSSVSTSSYDVYRGDTFGPQRFVQTGQFSYDWVQSKDGGHFFYAISKDKKTLIYWNEPKGTLEVRDKCYYNRIDESTLNVDSHDFLN